LTDELALVETVDFFTPVVDDPFLFGRIAAANALSDVYAMGGTPLVAMNIVCFPAKELEIEVLTRILEGGLEALAEADTALAGGHSVEDKELKYGLCVTGTIHPSRVLTKGGARPGDKLVLTKPLGTGIVSTALKAGLASEAAVAAATASMGALNRAAAEIGRGFGIHACTDVTGFGLLGHASEMLAGSATGLVLDSSCLPVLPEAASYAGMGLVPAGLHRNRAFYTPCFEVRAGVPHALVDLVCDPQTSGGLLFALPAAEAPALVLALARAGIDAARVIGEIVADPGEKVVLG
jgi:selenide, water dikinase